MLKRAYSELTVKAVDEDERVIRGTATTPSPDRMGDIVVPTGAKFKNPSPLLWQHDSLAPIGTVKFDKPTADGITFEARLPKVTEPGALKDRVDEAWQSLKYGLIRAVSIGFRALDNAVEVMQNGGLRFLQCEILELSLVSIPAQPKATISEIRSYDKSILAASGRPPVKLIAGVSAKSTEEASPMKTWQEQIQAFEGTRQAKAARMSDMMNKAAEEGRGLSTEEATEYDGLESDVNDIDAHLVRLRKQAQTAAATAQVVDTNTNNARRDTVTEGSRSSYVTAQRQLPKGTAFVRSVQALIRAKGNPMHAVEIAKNDPAWKDTPEVEMFWKTAVASGTITDSTFAGPLAPYIPMQNEFIELLRPTTIIGRIPGGLRNIPFMVSMPRQTGGASAGWVGEGAPKPVSKQAFETIQMPPTKISVITVITEELARYSTPSAEAVIRDDLLASIRQYQDQQFIDPTVAVSAGVRPAAITNGATNYTISGTTIAAITTDVNKLVTAFIAANIYPERGVFVMHPRTAQYLGTLRTTQDVLAFPGISMTGGTFFGWPVVTSANVPIDTGDDTYIVLMDAAEIFLAEDGGIELDISREASLQMNTAPDNPPSASTVFTSLWQSNLVGLRSEHRVGWKRRRDGAVAYLKGVSY